MVRKGKGKNNRVHHLDRNKVVGPLTNFQRVANPEGAEEMGILATYENNRYGVFLKVMMSDGFSVPGPDGKPMPMEVIHLIITRLDKKKIEIPWEEKQFIKNQLLGESVEGLELFPAEARRMRTIRDYQTHLFIFPPRTMIPVGMIPKAMHALAQRDALDKFTVTKEELEVYTVEDGGILQVFASEDEARKSYGDAGNEMPEGKVGRIGDVPTQDTGAVWSEKAKGKIANVLHKSETLTNLLNEDREEVDPIETRVNTNGPLTDQDELEEEMGAEDHAPNSDEENVMMPEFMELGVEQMKRDRIKSVGAAVSKLEERIKTQEEAARQEAIDEEKAKEELEAMREEARKERVKDPEVN